jgi:K+-sensing histidine kinase KdpD
VHFRRDAESFSLSEIPLVIALFFVAPVQLVTAQVVGAGVALVFNRRQSTMKLVFNLSQFAAGTAIATVVFRVFAEKNGVLGVREAGAAGIAVLVATIFGVTSVVAAISLAERRTNVAMVPKVLSLGLIMSFTNTSVALVAAVLLRSALWTTWLLVIPATTLFVAYRAYQQQRTQNESLEFLYESTRMLQGSLDIEDTVRALLEQVRKMFRAEVARVTLFPTEGEASARRTIVGPGDEWTFMQPVVLDPQKGVWARVASEGQAICIPRPIRNERLRAYFQEEGGLKDAMVAPLFGDGYVIGTLLVANRLGDVTTFDHEDLKLFETFANHASIALENAHLVSRLRGSLAKMTEMNRVKDEFVATVSHELRTPLTSIIGFIKTLRRTDVEYTREEIASMLGAADRQSANLHSLIEDLLLVSRIESKPIRTERANVAVSDLLNELVHDFSARNSGHRLQLTTEDDVMISSDETALRRILSNLVENAIKYSPANTTVCIEALQDAKGIRFVVQDEGPGIPEEARERIFDRFFQMDQSNTRSVGGVGLGLYICRSLASSIGGSLTVGESTSGGAAFTLWIPQDARAESVHPARLRRVI